MPPDETPQIRVESSNSVTAERATRKSSSDDLDKNDKSTLSAKDGGKRSVSLPIRKYDVVMHLSKQDVQQFTETSV